LLQAEGTTPRCPNVAPIVMPIVLGQTTARRLV